MEYYCILTNTLLIYQNDAPKAWGYAKNELGTRALRCKPTRGNALRMPCSSHSTFGKNTCVEPRSEMITVYLPIFTSIYFHQSKTRTVINRCNIVACPHPAPVTRNFAMCRDTLTCPIDIYDVVLEKEMWGTCYGGLCKNGGTCSPAYPYTFECQCPKTYTGLRCGGK